MKRIYIGLVLVSVFFGTLVLLYGPMMSVTANPTLPGCSSSCYNYCDGNVRKYGGYCFEDTCFYNYEEDCDDMDMCYNDYHGWDFWCDSGAEPYPLCNVTVLDCGGEFCDEDPLRCGC